MTAIRVDGKATTRAALAAELGITADALRKRLARASEPYTRVALTTDHRAAHLERVRTPRDEDKRAKVRALRETGLSLRAIGRAVGISGARVAQLLD